MRAVKKTSPHNASRMQLACRGVMAPLSELVPFVLDLLQVGVLSLASKHIFTTSARFLTDSTIRGPFQPRIQEALTQQYQDRLTRPGRTTDYLPVNKSRTRTPAKSFFWKIEINKNINQ